MEILLVRHAIAFEHDPRRWPDDADRPLTPAGAKKFRRYCKLLAERVPRVAYVLTSPFVRARQTADILRDTAYWAEAIDCTPLAPGQSSAAILKLLRTQNHQRLALVGHEPNLSKLLSAAIAGMDADVRIAFKKGAVASLTFEDDVRVGRGQLDWMIPPRLLRRRRE